MKNIFAVFVRDFNAATKNYVSLIIIAALIMLPAAYAWFNIQACWDPYSKTSGLKVAVTNLDKGGKYRSIKINLGDKIVDKLKGNKKIGWVFVDEKEASEGLKYGKYYASICITKDFTNNIMSVITKEEPVKAELQYSVNEKRNAIAPRITQSGITSLQDEITRTFIESSSELVFTYLKQLGIEYKKYKPELNNLVQVIYDIDSSMPYIGANIDNAYASSLIMEEYIKNVEAGLPHVSDTLNNSISLLGTGSDMLQKSKTAIKMLMPLAGADMTIIKSQLNNTNAMLNGISQASAENISSSIDVLSAAKSQLDLAGQKSDENLKILSALKSLVIFKNGAFDKTVGKLYKDQSSLGTKIKNQSGILGDNISRLNKGEGLSQNIISSLSSGNNNIIASLDTMQTSFEKELIPLVDTIMTNTDGAAQSTKLVLEDARNNIPLISGVLKQAELGADNGVKGLKEAKTRFPVIQNEIHKNAENIRKLQSDKRLEGALELLQRDAVKESEFIANPISVKQIRVYPIPNYGSAMTPFYTTLALWVGAFMLLSLLSVKVEKFSDKVNLNPRQEFMGRFLLFAVIAVIQALVVSLGDLFILRTYAADKAIFVGSAVFISIVFVMIIYSLVSVFGNVGKAMAMILLVLQVSASGGTYPIEMTPLFFRIINPFLPFTYAIGGLREAVGGTIWSVFAENEAKLLIYYVLALLLGLLLKEKINYFNSGFIKKFKESGLSGE